MSASSLLEYIAEQLAPIGAIKTGRFFGGVGLKAGHIQFGMLMGGSLYFVVDDSTRPMYERAGSQCFSYATKKGAVQVRRYYEVPPELVEEAPALQALARESIRVAASSSKARKSRAV